MIKNIFPIELRKAISCLGDEKRQLIISKLYASECSYTELKDEIATTKGNLNHHLAELQKAGIIMNYSKHELTSPYDSYYAIGIFGKDLIDGILDALKPSNSIPPYDSPTPRSSSPTQGFTLVSPLYGIGEHVQSQLSVTLARKMRMPA